MLFNKLIQHEIPKMIFGNIAYKKRLEIFLGNKRKENVKSELFILQVRVKWGSYEVHTLAVSHIRQELSYCLKDIEELLYCFLGNYLPSEKIPSSLQITKNIDSLNYNLH